DAVWQLTGAAPLRLDAQVVRARLKSADGSAATAPPLKAAWIWSDGDAAKAPAGQTITFRRQFKLAAAPTRAVAVITCDNEYKLLVNGREVASDDNWETVEVVPLESSLKQGDNEILIVGKNAGRGPNAAGLIFEAAIKLADDKDVTVATGAGWQWTAAQPDARGKFKAPPDWQPAVEIKPAAVWTIRVGQALPTMLQHGTAGP